MTNPPIRTPPSLVGLAFGQLLADRLDLSWVGISDDRRTPSPLRFAMKFAGKTVKLARPRTAISVPLSSVKAYDDLVHTAESIG
jgi:hypothetical protein